MKKPKNIMGFFLEDFYHSYPQTILGKAKFRALNLGWDVTFAYRLICEPQKGYIFHALLT
jgi:hypothetical protein